jgi:hypothetical protein
MAELIVVDRIDGNPVAWRCSQCRQVFSIPGKLTTEERRIKMNAEFKAHLRRDHATKEAVANTNPGRGQICSA